jgi:hypothetical protein
MFFLTPTCADLGHRWVPSPGRVEKATLVYVFSIRIKHSPTQGEAISCTRGYLSASSCNSSLVRVETGIDRAYFGDRAVPKFNSEFAFPIL